MRRQPYIWRGYPVMFEACVRHVRTKTRERQVTGQVSLLLGFTETQR